MNFGLLIIGDEILSGKRADQHLPHVIELLAARGLSLAWARYAGDDPQRITADLRDALAGAAAHGDVVFSCGGIGATPDDHTRACAAAAANVPLQMHPQARELIIERMRDVAAERGLAFEPQHSDNLHRLNMAVFPQSAELIPNPYNKIAGFALRPGAHGGGVYFVPGFPVMAWPMMAWVLDQHYPHLHHKHAVRERSVIVIGALESTLTPLMEAIEAQFSDIKVFSLPSVAHPEWGAHIELGVKPADAAHVVQLDVAYEALKQGLCTLRQQLGPELVR